jgi:putative oxidoreductase
MRTPKGSKKRPEGGGSDMRMLALSPLNRLAQFAPLVVRVIVGVIISAHGWQKLMGGPANFAAGLAQQGIPLPGLMAWVVTFVELVGGILLIVGLFSRLAALLLTIEFIVIILTLKIPMHVPLIAPPHSAYPGVELDLALLAGFLVVLLMGPGRISLDHALGIERGVAEEPADRSTREGRSKV